MLIARCYGKLAAQGLPPGNALPVAVTLCRLGFAVSFSTAVAWWHNHCSLRITADDATKMLS